MSPRSDVGPARQGAGDEVVAGNRTLLRKLAVVVVVMFAFGYALVPFYEKICEVTGMRDVARADDVQNTQVDYTKRAHQLDSNVRRLPWEFRPLETVVGVHPGELRQVTYEMSTAPGATSRGRRSRATGRRSRAGTSRSSIASASRSRR